MAEKYFSACTVGCLTATSICGTCSGTKLCPNCHGADLDCPFCEEGACPECEGTGRPRSWLRELWDSYDGTDYFGQRALLAGVVLAIGLSFMAWKFVVAFSLFVGGILLYLRRYES